MAASRTDSAFANRFSSRISFAQVSEPVEVPNLIGLQTESFDWLLGNSLWKDRVEAAKKAGRNDVPEIAGLQEIFEEISPIEDFGQTMSLSFSDPYFEEPRHTPEECKEKDFTYSAQLFVTAEFMNNTTGEIKSQTVFMGDFPLMSPRGTFIINGTERVVVSQLVRSPGVYFESTPDKTSDKDIFTAKMIPSRGAWLEFEIDKRDSVGVRVDRKRKQSVTLFLKALGLTDEDIAQGIRRLPLGSRDPREGHRPHSRGRSRRPVPQAAPGRAAHGRGRSEPSRQLLLQPQALRPREGGPLQAQQEARPRPRRSATRCLAWTTSSPR